MALENFEKIESLLPGNGENDGTVFTDWSISARSWTAIGNVKTSTGNFKYYDSSILFDGSGDYLELADSPSLRFGSGDFCVSAWVYITASATYNPILVKGTGTFIGITPTTRYLYISFNNNAVTLNTATAVALNTWTFCEVGRASGTVYLSIDGATPTTGSFNSALTQTDVLRIGRGSGTSSNYFSGNIQDHIYKVGAPPHTEAFTPPTRAIGEISNLGSGANAILDNFGDPAVRTLVFVPRKYPTAVRTATSDSNGRYAVSLPAIEHDCIFMDDDAESVFPDILVSRVLPA